VVSSVTLASAGATATAGVGAWGIYPSSAVGTGLRNYAITYVPGILTVGAKGLVITALDTNKVYGSTVTFTGNEFRSEGLTNADVVSSVSLSSAGAEAAA